MPQPESGSLLEFFVNLYDSTRWPTEAHKLNCTSMFAVFVNRAGPSSTLRSLYREGNTPDYEDWFGRWRQCLKLKSKSLATQQVILEHFFLNQNH